MWIKCESDPKAPFAHLTSRSAEFVEGWYDDRGRWHFGRPHGRARNAPRYYYHCHLGVFHESHWMTQGGMCAVNFDWDNKALELLIQRLRKYNSRVVRYQATRAFALQRRVGKALRPILEFLFCKDDYARQDLAIFPEDHLVYSKFLYEVRKLVHPDEKMNRVRGLSGRPKVSPDDKHAVLARRRHLMTKARSFIVDSAHTPEAIDSFERRTNLPRGAFRDFLAVSSGTMRGLGKWCAQQAYRGRMGRDGTGAAVKKYRSVKKEQLIK